MCAAARGFTMTFKKPKVVSDTSMAIAVHGLTYYHPSTSDAPSLSDISLQLPSGSRTVIVGANGAGKSTLLQILAGKRLINNNGVRINGRDVFRDSPPNIAFLGTEWAMNPVVRGDIVVSAFLDSIGGYRHRAQGQIA
jgi:CCR4-NOT complex subunit CAF16